MEVPSLIHVGDLAGFEGAPFSTEAVLAASEQIRRLCGWHIAPSVTETIVVDSAGGDRLWLPSRHVTEVTSVRDVTGETPVDIAFRWSASGVLSGRFPAGFRAVEVTLTHGHEECPEDLLPAIVDRTRRRVMQESLGSRSVSFSAESDRTIDSHLSLYKLGPRP